MINDKVLRGPGVRQFIPFIPIDGGLVDLGGF